jgi:hypothetical protein
MTKPPSSSSRPRPLGPAQDLAQIQQDGMMVGPIRLPTSEAAGFIDAFNAVYQAHNLKIAHNQKGATDEVCEDV